MKTIKSFLVLAVAVLTSLSASSTWAVEWLLYDTFNAKLINPDKWVGRISTSTGNELLDTIREIKGNRLHLLGRGYTRTDTTGGESISQVQLFFTNTDIVAIKANIQVNGYQLVGCDDDANSRVRARIVGSFFNAATPTPGSLQDDVWAHIRLQRNADSTDPYNVLRVLGDIFRCTDSACNGTSPVSDSSADLGTARVGERVTLSLEWDQAAHRFIFQRTGGGDNGIVGGKITAEASLYYTVPDIQPPGAKFRRLEVSESLTNCGIKQPHPVGFIDAYFDNVSVNQ